MSGMLYTSANSQIVVSVSGVKIDNQTWDKFSGAGHTMDTSTYNAGNMAPAIAIGGVSKRASATIERAWDDTLISTYLNLDGAVGSPVSIKINPLKNRSTFGPASRSFTGLLKEVNPPESDSTSSTIQMLSIVVELNETISG